MGFRDSEHYGYTNGKLLWFAESELYNLLADAVFASCCGRERGKKAYGCDGCIALKAEPILEKQIIDEGVKFMTSLVNDWEKANRKGN